MWRLIEAEIWRDGGSYSAVITDGAQSLALWLQVNAWTELTQRSYGALHVSPGSDPTLKAQRIPPTDERQWLTLLSEQTDTASASDIARQCLGEIVAILRERTAG